MRDFRFLLMIGLAIQAAASYVQPQGGFESGPAPPPRPNLPWNNPSSPTLSRTELPTNRPGSYPGETGIAITPPAARPCTGDCNLQCSGPGFFRHPKDCARFIRCVDNEENPGQYQVYEFDCPAGLVFDEAASTCNWPEQTTPCEVGGPKPFPQSLPGSSENQPGPDGDFFAGDGHGPGQQGQPQSQHPGGGFPGSPHSQHPGSGSPHQQHPGGGSPGSPQGPSGNRGSSVPPSGQSGGCNPCKSAGFFRHPQTCEKFIRCVDFFGNGQYTVFNFDCPAGLVFDERHNVCNWPHEAPPCDSVPAGNSCSEQPPSPPGLGGQGGPGQGGPQDHPVGGNQLQQRQPNGNQPQDGGWQPEPESQQPPFDQEPNPQHGQPSGGWQPQSTGGQPRPGGGQPSPGGGQPQRGRGRPQQGGYQPQPESGGDEPQPGGWQPEPQGQTGGRQPQHGGGQPQPGSGQPQPGGGRPQHGGGQPQHRGGQPQHGGGQPQHGGERPQPGGGRPQPGNFQPDNGEQPDEEITPPGYGGNKPRRRNEQPQDDSQPPQDLGRPQRGGRQPSGGGYPQQGGNNPQDNGQNPNSPHNPTAVGPRATGNTGGCQVQCQYAGFFRNPSNCHKFYRCVDFYHNGQYTVFHFDCPAGLVFDERISVCNWPQNSPPCDGAGSGGGGDCNGGSPGSSSGPPTQDIDYNGPPDNQRGQGPSDGQQPPTDDQPPQSQAGPPGPSGNPPAPSSQANCPAAGFYRNPQNCHKFFRCVDFFGNGDYTVFNFDCPGGLVFDERVSVCNWPDQAPPCDSSPVNSRRPPIAPPAPEENAPPAETTTADTDMTTGDSSTEVTSEGTTDSTGSTMDSTESTTDSSESTTSRTGKGIDGRKKKPKRIKCPGTANYEVPGDCTKFFRCAKVGTGKPAQLFQCMDGYVFNQEVQFCKKAPADFKCMTKMTDEMKEMMDEMGRAEMAPPEMHIE